MTRENILARYTVLHELGRGATGAVYAARDRTTGAVVALKRLDPAALQKPDAGVARRFLNQARAARRLKHRNIVEILDAGEAGGTVYVATEMVEGTNLRRLMEEPLALARAIHIAREIASGLAYAHLQGVVHGSLKPTNVIVPASGDVKIADFGLGQASAPYQAPEQAQGGAVDHRSDVFSFGALLYEMLTREKAGARPKPPSTLNPHVPRALDDIVLGMLATQPAVRMPGIPVLLGHLQRLEEALGLAPGAQPKPEPRVEPPKPEPRPEPKLEPRVEPKPAPEPAAAPAAIRHRRRVPDHEVVDPPRRVVDAPKEAFDSETAMAIMERESRRPRRSRSLPAVLAALAVVLVGAGIARSDIIELPDFTALAGSFIAAPAPPPAPAIPPSPAPAPVAETPKAPAPVEPAPVLAAAPPSPPPVVREAPVQQEPQPVEEPRAPEPSPPPPPAKSVVERPPAPAKPPVQAAPAKEVPQKTAQLILAVSPRGELYVNGKHEGTTPPMTTFQLEPGMHRIEVRSGKRRPYLTYMILQAGDVRRIRHDFDAKPVRPH